MNQTKLSGLIKKYLAPLIYSSSSLMLSFANFISGIIIIRWLQPEQLGVWHSVRLAITYSQFLLCGINNGLNRELPYYLGREDHTKAKDLAGTALYLNVFACSIGICSGLAATLYFHNESKVLVFSIITVTILIVTTFYRNYLTVTFRSKDSFGKLGNIQFVEAILLLISIPLIYFLTFDGMLLRLIITSIIALVIIHAVRPIKALPVFNKESTIILLKTGIPIFILDYIVTSAATCDRLALLRIGGPVLVGYYALASIANETIAVLPNSIANYFYSRMSFSYGKTNDPKVLWKAAVKIFLFIPLLMLPIAIVGYYAMPPVITMFFPKYIPGIKAAQIMFFVALFSGASIGSNVIWTLKAFKWMTAYQICLASMLLIFPFAGAYLHSSPLLGVVFGLLITRIIAFFLSIVMSYKATHEKRIDALSALS